MSWPGPRACSSALGPPLKRAEIGLAGLVGSFGDGYGNSMIEGSWSRMQVDLLDRKRDTGLELANAIFEYLEILHNRDSRLVHRYIRELLQTPSALGR